MCVCVVRVHRSAHLLVRVINMHVTLRITHAAITDFDHVHDARFHAQAVLYMKMCLPVRHAGFGNLLKWS